MDTNSELENSLNDIKQEEETDFLEIINLVPQIEASLKGTPLPEQSRNILEEFERGEKGGVIRETKLPIIPYSFELENKVKNKSKEYISKVQEINPDVPLGKIPVYLLSSPVNRIACALKDEGVAINTRYFLVNQKDGKYIANTLVHEATHIYINRLGKQPEFLRGDYKREILDFLWFEGLAQHMEPYPNEISEMFKEDGDKWPEILNTWFKTESIEEKLNLINTITDMGSFKKIMEYRHGRDYENSLQNLLERTKPDEALKGLIVHEGFGYYIGKHLWEQELKKGKNLKDIVMKGSKDVENWIV